jgi:hypothetical protein
MATGLVADEDFLSEDQDAGEIEHHRDRVG